jgi:outer membrane scaffolding protein for murein synthesis (MipA/OmpV family)
LEIGGRASIQAAKPGSILPMSSLSRAALALLACLAGSPALAQTGLAPQAAPALGQPEIGRWRVAIGAGVLYSPDYLGSNEWRTIPLIAPEIRGPFDSFYLSFRDGIGATLYRDGGFSAGVVGRWRFGRDQDDNAALAGMGDINPSGEAGGFIRYGDRTWLASLEVRYGFGGFSGLVADARLDRVFRVADNVILSTGPRLSWGGSGFAETYFGVTPDQSARSGYAVFQPDNYWFGAIAAGATWVISERFSLTAFGEVGQIFGSTADSPLIAQGSATQGVVGLALAYRFSP